MNKIIILLLAIATCQAMTGLRSKMFGSYVSEYKKFHTEPSSLSSPLPHEYTKLEDLPDSFNWGDVNGTSFLTKSLNQHLPQYCGSCWAHGALSSLADRIKIARKGKGADINLAIQFILNCGAQDAGSCHGGDHLAVFEFIKKVGQVPYDTCLQYEACSQESTEGSCKGRSSEFQCTAKNTCRTCSTFSANGGFCSELDTYPNATVAEYGQVQGVEKMKLEIYKRGPIAIGINAEPILNYKGGIYDNKDEDRGVNHIVSCVGWGVENGKSYWIIRNSWGEYWGELGYVRVAMGDNQLGVEQSGAWATPGSWTEHNFPCGEDGTDCVKKVNYVDPSAELFTEL